MREFKNIIDLSHVIHPGMQTFSKPWHKPVEFEALGNFHQVGRRTTQIHIGTHAGTHIDAPSHFIEDGESVDKIILSRLVGPATLFNFSSLENRTPVTSKMLEAESKSQPLHKRLILRYDWSIKYGSSDFYSEHPYLDDSAADWIIDKNLQAIGYDTSMPDSADNGFGSECDSPMHSIFLANGIPLIEYLSNLNQLPREFMLCAVPLRLQGLDGSPIRCVGVF